ncbi:hypothetical protein CoNPh17_CDS0011 [Staphylococcus phage S-CoN_Ph17]|nr:hypothetical protein CoNPh17_CDS0011 [Staphylococcus phage S-CoN_Ph17]
MLISTNNYVTMLDQSFLLKLLFHLILLKNLKSYTMKATLVNLH